MFSHLISLTKKFCKSHTFNAICKNNAAINCITVERTGSFPSTSTGHTSLVHCIYYINNCQDRHITWIRPCLYLERHSISSYWRARPWLLAPDVTNSFSLQIQKVLLLQQSYLKWCLEASYSIWTSLFLSCHTNWLRWNSILAWISSIKRNISSKSHDSEVRSDMNNTVQRNDKRLIGVLKIELWCCLNQCFPNVMVHWPVSYLSHKIYSINNTIAGFTDLLQCLVF
jgi:hypothetical protein